MSDQGELKVYVSAIVFKQWTRLNAALTLEELFDDLGDLVRDWMDPDHADRTDPGYPFTGLDLSWPNKQLVLAYFALHGAEPLTIQTMSFNREALKVDMMAQALNPLPNFVWPD